MGRFCTIAVALLSANIILVTNAWTDELVMTTGERFVSSKIWEEDGKIRFNMQGLVVSVEKRDVAAIIRSQPTSASRQPKSPIDSPPLQSSETSSPPPQPPMQQSFSAPERISEPKSARHRKQSNPNGSQTAKRRRGTGLKGISWHMRPENIPGLQKIETDPAYGGIDQYGRPDQLHSLGKADLDGWIFGFWRDRLYSIMLWADGRSAYEDLRREVFSIYGKGVQNKPTVERFVWLDQDTQRMLEFDDRLNTGIFIMRSSELDAKIKQLYPK